MQFDWKRYLKAAGWILALVGLIDIPEQLQRWVRLFQSLIVKNIDWSSPLLGDLTRTGITAVGVLLLLFSYHVPQWLLLVIVSWRRPQSPFHILPSQNGVPYVRREDEYSSSGLLQGQRSIWYLMIQNNGLQTVNGMEASIVTITPTPSETDLSNHIINRELPMPQRLKFGSECSALNIGLTPGNLVQLRYASYTNAALSPKRIRLEGSNHEFYPDEDTPYLFNIRVTGDNVPPASIEIRLTRHGDRITVKPLEIW